MSGTGPVAGDVADSVADGGADSVAGDVAVPVAGDVADSVAGGVAVPVAEDVAVPVAGDGFDLVIRNGLVLTMDAALSRKGWLAVKDGVIKALGDGDFSGTAAETIDLKGRVLMPGLIDTHAHSAMTGIGRRGIDLAGIDTVGGILDRVESFCREDKTSKVVCGCNMLTPEAISEKRLPSRDELDEVSGDRPLMLVMWTAHGGTMNSAAFEKAMLTPEMQECCKDGVFVDDKTAFHVIGNIYNLMEDKDFEEIFFGIAAGCVSRGITTLHSLDGMMVKDDRDVDVLMRVKDRLPIEFVVYTQTFDWEKVCAYGLGQVGGCLSVDGSPPQITAAYQDPYPSAPNTRGFLNFTDSELHGFVTAASKAGMQVAFHAIGDRAVDQIVHIYQQVDREVGIRNLRHRVEHFSLPTDHHIEMAAEMNVVCSAQPAIGNMLDGPAGNGFDAFVSKEKAQLHENFARVMKGGVAVCGGSDSPVTPLDAFVGIDAAVNAFNPGRRVSVTEALRMYTINAAYAAHQEKTKGSLEVGKQADMIVIDKDPYEPDTAAALASIEVLQTWRAGKLVFERP